MDANAAFAAWLRTTRRQAGLSQQKVADALTAEGLTFWQTSVDKIERGARGIRLVEAVALVRLFGTTIDDALGLKAGPDSVPDARLARHALLLARIRDDIDAELRGDAR